MSVSQTLSGASALKSWASIKAAYRFLSNDRVDEHAILSGHMKATARRIRAADGPILSQS